MFWYRIVSVGLLAVQRDFDRLGRPVEIDYGDADASNNNISTF